MVDRHEHQRTELHQMHYGSGDNLRDKYVINYNLYGSVDYQQLAEALRNKEKLLAGIAPKRTDLRLKYVARLNCLKRHIEDFKANVLCLYELFTRIPINTKRLQLAKEHFDRGEFREADAVLKAEEISAEVAQLKARRAAAAETVAAIDRDLADKAHEFLLKARLSLVNPAAEGESKFKRTEQYFEKALAAARTAEVLHEYARFLCEHNAFRQAELLYQEALKQGRSLAEANPEAFLPTVANTLNNLAVLSCQTNAFGPALAAYQEALKTYRSLAKANPEAFLQHVAGTLNNLANLHRAQNAFGPALAAYEEALKLYRSLAEANPEAFLPYVANTLNNLANLHSDQNAFGLALEEYEEALRIRRSLAEAKPEAFLQHVAGTLNNLGLLHYKTNAFGPALEEYEEALKIRRSLAKASPEAFLPDVAQTLNNLANLHSDQNAFGPALEEYEEALKIRRSLAEASPEAFLQDVAKVLNNLANLHSNQNAFGPALEEYEEALKIRRSLAEAKPEAFLPAMTETLISLSIFYLYAVPDRAKSIAYAEEARSILVPLCAKMPHLQGLLDKAEQVLATNAAKTAA